MTAPAATPSGTGAKSPADFQQAADGFNNLLDGLLRAQATAVKAVSDHMANREALVASAKDFGLTGSYARALLRKA